VKKCPEQIVFVFAGNILFLAQNLAFWLARPFVFTPSIITQATPFFFSRFHFEPHHGEVLRT
tara:strand:- start:209 stop:394 length:186 start_codon:yes stop_codon:yes gene_type:complete